MNKTEILVVGRHEQILETVVRLINNNPEWHGVGALTNAEAIQLFNHEVFDLVLLSSGIDKTEENDLRAYFIDHRPNTLIVQHYGGGSGLLTAEIYEALKNKQ
ncbi:hypothetical protein HH214_01785 [Mucilaginibacter robiniae]|uniref:Response regulator receiver protein n=1 Tax=Mucilaginibacter robiniae TaxID=2728022 RepID=A0A7L5DUA7_9SPHI|nr:hypothetical protein [Mucilaginibacter robiniae]QJD94690.1 hypothetical protein HH214_01785 [Mucilaginibacter robiniae]